MMGLEPPPAAPDASKVDALARQLEAAQRALTVARGAADEARAETAVAQAGIAALTAQLATTQREAADLSIQLAAMQDSAAAPEPKQAAAGLQGTERQAASPCASRPGSLGQYATAGLPPLGEPRSPYRVTAWCCRRQAKQRLPASCRSCRARWRACTARWRSWRRSSRSSWRASRRRRHAWTPCRLSWRLCGRSGRRSRNRPSPCSRRCRHGSRTACCGAALPAPRRHTRRRSSGHPAARCAAGCASCSAAQDAAAVCRPAVPASAGPPLPALRCSWPRACMRAGGQAAPPAAASRSGRCRSTWRRASAAWPARGARQQRRRPSCSRPGSSLRLRQRCCAAARPQQRPQPKPCCSCVLPRRPTPARLAGRATCTASAARLSRASILRWALSILSADRNTPATWAPIPPSLAPPVQMWRERLGRQRAQAEAGELRLQLSSQLPGAGCTDVELDEAALAALDQVGRRVWERRVPAGPPAPWCGCSSARCACPAPPAPRLPMPPTVSPLSRR